MRMAGRVAQPFDVVADRHFTWRGIYTN
jgi:hypothetical protein